MDNVYRYYIYENNEVKGPFVLEELVKQNIKEDTYICYEGGDGWYLAAQFPEINEILKSSQNKINQVEENFSITIEEKKEESKEEKILKEKPPAQIISEKIEFPECVNHPGRESFAICCVCLKDYCEECLEKVSGKFYCKECKPKASGFFSKLFKK
ncbi:MAG TPA: DUF4339 domain-containing protein [bacterium]|nr:DUF4339 domain-containing protein [bacterium]HOL47145.1 DUF4339 domain-containing protein [bacterium]HPQ18068.1 DUF4339 domain-containing protein [bacterium]